MINERRTPAMSDLRSLETVHNRGARGVYILLGLHLTVLLGQFLLHRVGGVPIHRQLEVFGLVPSRVVQDLWIWQLFTSLWLHSPGMPFQWAFNMIGLWVFGSVLESRIGRARFLLFFGMSGIVGGVIYCAAQYVVGPAHPAFGSSVSVVATVLLVCLYHPNRILLFLLFPIRLRVLGTGLLVLLVGTTVLSGQNEQACVAQIGGGCFAFLAYRWWRRPNQENDGTPEEEKTSYEIWAGGGLLVSVLLIATSLALMNRKLPELSERALERSLGTEVAIYRTDHFVLYGQGEGRSMLEGLGRSMEEFYIGFLGRYGERFSIRPFSKKVSLVLFRDKNRLRRWYRRRYGNQVSHSAGFYDPSKRLIGVAISEDDPIRIAYHECVHMLFDPGGEKRWSRWLSEGFAMLFENGLAGRSVESAELSRFLRWRSEGRPGTHLQDLLVATESSFRGSDHMSYYLGSRLLLEFLLHAPSLRVRRHFLESHYRYERSRGPQSIRQLSKIYEMDLGELDQQWLRYMEGLFGEGM